MLADSAGRRRALLSDSDSEGNSRLRRKISPRGTESRVPRKVPSSRRYDEKEASSDEDFNTIISNELRRRSGYVVSPQVAPVSREGFAETADQNAQDSKSDSEGDAFDWASHTHRARTTNPGNVSTSLQNLLTRMQTRESDPGGFNDIIKDAIHDKLRKSKRAPTPSSTQSGQKSTGNEMARHSAPESLFSIEAHMPRSPPDSSPPLERTSKPKNRTEGDSVGRTTPCSERDLDDDVEFDASVNLYGGRRRRRLDGRATRRLIQYFEAKKMQMFFRAAWYE
jgi:hypothetical protein